MSSTKSPASEYEAWNENTHLISREAKAILHYPDFDGIVLGFKKQGFSSSV